MRRAVAALLVLTAVLVGATSVDLGSGAGATVGRSRPAKVKCGDAGARATAVLTGHSTPHVLLPGRAKVLRFELAGLGKHKRRDFLHALARAAIVMCRQKAHGVPWTAAAAKTYFIPSESMIPAIKVGDRILVNIDAYKTREPKRGQIAVHTLPAAVATDVIKQGVHRIVGLPGETIEGRDGEILIDGQPLAEPYLRPSVKSRTFGPVQIPPGSYFVLGDNRQYSKDSTFYGPITRVSLVGPAVVL